MFIRLKYTSVKALIAGVLISTSAHAAPLLAVGNIAIRTESLEKIIREMVAVQLGAQLTNSTLSVLIPETKESVTIPQTTGTLKSVLDTLGLGATNTLPITISPIKADFTVPTSAFNITMQNRSANVFAISAKFSLTSLSAKSDALSITLPTSLFNQAAAISSSPVQISLAKGSPSIQFEIDLLANLGSNGATFKLQGFKSNLTSAHPPQLAMTLGKLTVNGQPLTLQVAQQGSAEGFTADEPTIRAELQTLESTYTKTIQAELATELQASVVAMGKSLQNQAPLKFDFKTDQVVTSATSLSNNEKSPLEAIEISGIASYLQTEQNSAICSTQISASVCLDGSCLPNTQADSVMSAADYALVQSTDDGAAILDESFVKNLTNSPAFQNRIKKLFEAANTTPGVSLGAAGVKVFIDPATESVTGILNLEIDIRKTVANGWSAEFERDIGSYIESKWGSGKVVKMPITVTIKVKGIEKNGSAGDNLVLDFTLPSFAADGSFVASPLCSATDCPNNIPNMTSTVRKSFLSQVAQQMKLVVPNEKKIPLSPFVFAPLSVQIHNIAITPSHGLLITAGLTDTKTPGAKP